MRSSVGWERRSATTASRFSCSSRYWRAAARSIATAPQGLGRGATGALLARRLGARDEGGIDLLEHGRAIDDDLLDVGATRQVVHDLEEDLFEDGPQTASAGAPQQGLVGDGTDKPYRLKVRSPNFSNLAALPQIVKGHRVADVVAVLSTLDVVRARASAASPESRWCGASCRSS